jgi:hypothetical protein
MALVFAKVVNRTAAYSHLGAASGCADQPEDEQVATKILGERAAISHRGGVGWSGGD